MIGIARDKIHYALVCLPLLFEYLEEGRIPSTLREWTTEIGLMLTLAVLARTISGYRRRAATLLRTDPLTGLGNRQKFLEDLVREIARAQRYRTPLSMAYIDVGLFREVNRQHGQSEGDILLTRLAYQIEKSTRVNLDSCYRIGGDEFAVLLPNTHLQDTQAVTNRIRAYACKAPCNLDKYGSHLAIGVVELAEEEKQAHFMDRALTALNEDKAKSAKNAETAAGA